MLFNAPVDIDIDEIADKLTRDGYSDEAKSLIRTLIGDANEAFNVTLEATSTLEADAEEFEDAAKEIVEELSERQKIVARAFLTALLKELGDA